MEKNRCPRCGKILNEAPLYQCCRCFTYYCKNCEDANHGSTCSKCRMGARLVLSTKQ